MSKFLKFLVNLFLVAAILVAGAILIPPLAGINTVIVDSETMDTNLPMGSVTYAKSADSASLAPGDEILLDIGSAVNAWNWAKLVINFFQSFHAQKAFYRMRFRR